MRRYLGITASTLLVYSGLAWAGPSAGSGPITVDNTTFVPGSSVMGTDGGVYSDTIPPVTSTNTAAFRMTAYRAEHVNLRNNSGVEIGTVGNPINVSGQTTVTLSTVTITNSSFSVTGSTVNINGTVPVSLQSVPAHQVFLATTSVSGSSVTVTNGNINVTNTGFNVNNSPVVQITSTPAFTLNGALPAGTANIGTVTGSTVNINGTIPVIGDVDVSGSSITVTNGFTAITNTPNVYLINPATVSVSGTPSVSVSNTPNVNVLNSSFSVSGSTVTVTGTVTAVPMGTQNVYMVNPTTSVVSGSVSTSGSSVTVTNGSIAISNTPSVTLSNTPSVYLVNPATVTFASTPNVNVVNVQTTTIQGAVNVTGSTVSVQGTFNTVITGTQTVNVINQPTVSAVQSGNWVQTMQVLSPIGTPTSVGYTGGSTQIPTQITDGVNTSSVTCNGGGCGLNVQIIGGAGAGGTSSAFGTAFPANGTASGFVGPSGGMQTARVDTSSNVMVNVTNTGFSVTGSTVNINGAVSISTATALNVTGSTVAISGTPTVFVGNTPSVNINNTPSVTVSNTVTANISNPLPAGSNVIGGVTISGTPTVAATQSGTWNVNATDTQSAQRWNVAFDTRTTTAVLTPASATTNVLISTPIAAVPSQTIRVFRLILSADAQTTITFRDGSTNFGDSQYLSANGSITLDLSNEPWYITSSGNAFTLRQSGTANIGIRVWYTQS